MTRDGTRNGPPDDGTAHPRPATPAKDERADGTATAERADGAATDDTADGAALVRAWLERHRLVAILRARREGPLLPVVRALVAAGVRCLEITLPTPGALAAISAAAAEFGDDVLVGAGTVTSADQVRAAAGAGARFTVSPAFDPEVVRAGNDLGLGSLPGAFSPTEVVAAWRCRPSAVKLFPAGSLGPGFVSALAGPLPAVPLVPTGGIGLPDVRRYLAAGALAVAVGSPLVGDALTGGSLADLRARAAAFTAEAAQAAEAAEAAAAAATGAAGAAVGAGVTP